MLEYTFTDLEELPARNVYDEAVRQFELAEAIPVRKITITDARLKADQAGLRRAVERAGLSDQMRVVTLKGELYLERMT
jgi:hypothetical protein